MLIIISKDIYFLDNYWYYDSNLFHAEVIETHMGGTLVPNQDHQGKHRSLERLVFIDSDRLFSEQNI